MMYHFKYKMPFYQKFNILFYATIAFFCIWFSLIPYYEETSFFESITTRIGSALFAIFFLYLSFNLIRTLRESKHYNPVIIDDESITFPFEVNGERTTWKLKEIDSIRFDYYKTSYNFRRHYFTELNKGSESIELHRSWMKPLDFLRLQVILRKQGIEIEPPI